MAVGHGLPVMGVVIPASLTLSLAFILVTSTPTSVIPHSSGYFSIMDMAKALSGGDASKIEELRKAVEKGFKAAGVELGGKLPSISQNTYTEVMKRFDDWANESKKTSGIED